jgi:hypothetical protein
MRAAAGTIQPHSPSGQDRGLSSPINGDRPGGGNRVAGIEQGTDTRRGQAGWITIEWTRDATQFCGFASVGQEGGGITLTYDQPGCSCGSQRFGRAP